MSPILQKALADLANPTQPATTTVSSIIDEQNPTTQAPTTVSESCSKYLIVSIYDTCCSFMCSFFPYPDM